MKYKSDSNLYRVNSDRGGFYQIFESRLGRYLTLSNRFIGVHSKYKQIKKTYFYDLVSELKDEKDYLHKALVFGLGSGTLQNLLQDKYSDIHITSVESDPALLDINNYFFHNYNKDNHQIILSDSFQFVKNSENIYDFHDKCDLVVVDFNLLGADYYSDVFLKETKNFLKKKGIFVVVFQRKNYLQNLVILKFVEKISMYYNKVTLLYSKNNILEVFCSDN